MSFVGKGKREEATAMCYSHRDHQTAESRRRREEEDRRRREELARQEKKERTAKKERELAKA